MEIRPGQMFDTPFESECVVITPPDSLGHFDAQDSEGVVCSFDVRMISCIYEVKTAGELRDGTVLRWKDRETGETVYLTVRNWRHLEAGPADYHFYLYDVQGEFYLNTGVLASEPLYVMAGNPPS